MAGVDDEVEALETTEIPDDAWSVAELNAEIEAVLESASGRFPTYVIGEIADVNPYSYGTFFELSDIEGEETISCLAWSNARDDFDHELEEGNAAIVRAVVDFYPEQGNTQLSVRDYWPVGESERMKELEELREELEEEGLLDDDRKRSLPEYPECIGVVTSLSGSAREDFTSTVDSRQPGVTIKLCGATVQGDHAVPSLVGAIQRLEPDPEVDVMVVTRGGGSNTDLWCFNEEPVVRSIADCSTPVVVAVGHEDDETLSEAVADRRAMTPTDAGVATTTEMDSVRQQVRQLEVRVETAYSGVVSDGLEAYDRRVESATDALRQEVAARLAAVQRAADLEQRITVAYRGHVDASLSALETRVHDGYRDLEADARIEAGTAEARRLRVVVAVLVALLLLGAAFVVLFVL